MKRIFVVMIMLCCQMMAMAQTLNPQHYDVDGDGKVSISDVTMLVNAILGKVNRPIESISLQNNEVTIRVGNVIAMKAEITPTDADYLTLQWSSSNEEVAIVSEGGNVTGVGVGNCVISASAMDGSGVTAEIAIIVSDTYDGHGYVNLGLPSGTLWATSNLGASKPEEYGNYYAWGETETKERYGWTYDDKSIYKWCSGWHNGRGCPLLTKYSTDSWYGYVDNNTELDLEDDAAYVNWGANWRMPSKSQMEELINTAYTTCELVTQNGVFGLKVTSLANGNFIFLPAAGRKASTDVSGAGISTYAHNYLSRTLIEYSNGGAYTIAFFISSDADKIQISGEDRSYGNPIRPVRNQEGGDYPLGL